MQALAALLLLAAAPAPQKPAPLQPAPWASAARAEIEAELAPYPYDVGIAVIDPLRRERFEIDAGHPMYLASAVKLLLLVELYRLREAGRLRFDRKLRYARRHIRDGAPRLNRKKLGTEHRITDLIVYMIRDSDNAATDMLLELFDVEEAAASLRAMGYFDVGPLVPMLDIRREVYRRLDPRADRLSLEEVRDVRWRNGFEPRLDLLQKHIGPPLGSYGERELSLAHKSYYELGRNHAPMRTMARVVDDLLGGRVVSPNASREILAVLALSETGGRRMRRAVPADRAVVHKTGTQHQRVVDVGYAELSDGTFLVVAAAVAGARLDVGEDILSFVTGVVYRHANATRQAAATD